MLKAKEYYRIMHFLKTESLDRFYPVEDYFLEVDDTTGEEYAVKYTGDSFLFQTNRESFNGFDYVEVLLESSEPYASSDVKLNLSQYSGGYDPVLVIQAEDKGMLEADVPMKLIFRIRKSTTMSESSRNLTNIKAIEIITPNNGATSIYDVCFRDENALYSLEQIDAFYENGRYYVLSRLHMEDVPIELIDHVYTATAGYAWMSAWEYDARVMNDSQKNALSYGKWLFAIVDQGIDSYKIAHGIADDEERFVMTDLITYRTVRW